MSVVVCVTWEDIEEGGRDIQAVLAPSIRRATQNRHLVVHRGLLMAESLETRQKQDYTVATSWYATQFITDERKKETREITAMLPLRPQALASFLEHSPGTGELYLPVKLAGDGSIVRQWVQRAQAVREMTYTLEEFEASK